MADITIDLSNYKDRVGNRVAPGTYRVIVEDAEQDTARSGNAMINLWLRVVEGEFEGATIVDRLVLTDNSLFRVVGFMQAIGMATPKKRLSINLRQFIGKVLDIEVDDGEPYNGRIKSEVRGYMRATKSAASSAVDDEFDALVAGTAEAAPEQPVLAGLATSEDDPLSDEAVDLDSLEL